MRFKQVTEQRYDEMLGILPPALMSSRGFLVGEPWSHRPCRITNRPDQPTFAAFVNYIGAHWEAEEPMTIAEFNAMGDPRQHEWVQS